MVGTSSDAMMAVGYAVEGFESNDIHMLYEQVLLGNKLLLCILAVLMLVFGLVIFRVVYRLVYNTTMKYLL